MPYVVESETSRYEIRARWPNIQVIPEPTSWEPNRTRQVLHGCDQAVAQAKTLSKSRGLWVHYDGQLYSSQPFTDYKRILKVAEAVKQVGFADVKIREEKTSVVLHDV